MVAINASCTAVAGGPSPPQTCSEAGWRQLPCGRRSGEGRAVAASAEKRGALWYRNWAMCRHDMNKVI